MKEDEMGWTYNTHVVFDKSVQNFGQKTPREKTIWKASMYM
jgi:hypothetical protein